MRVQQDARLVPALRHARNVVLEDAREFGLGAAVVAAGLQRAVVADAHDVRAQVGERVRVRLRGRGRMHRRDRFEPAQRDRRTQARHPRVAAVLEPVVVADAREALAAPARPPRVLQPEALVVEGHDGEGMAAGDAGRLGDDAVGAHVVPAGVHGAGDVQDADLRQRGVHRDDVLVVHAEVGAQRPAQRVGRARVGQALRVALLRGLVGEQRLGAHAVLVPALHRAARAGAAVVLAGPLVVASRQLVEHARAHRHVVGHHAAAQQQVVGHRGQPEAGARALAALVEDRHAVLHVVAQRHVRRHLDQRGEVHEVAEVERVGAGVEHAPGCGVIRGGTGLRRARALLRAARGPLRRDLPARGLRFGVEGDQLGAAFERIGRCRAGARSGALAGACPGALAGGCTRTGGRLHRRARAQHLLRHAIEALAVGRAVLSAVDAPRDLREIARVGQCVEALAFPEKPCDGEPDLRRRGLVGVAHEVEAHQVAEGLVVGASGDLDRPAPLEAPAVAGLRVAQPAREVARRLVALLRGGRSPDLLHELQLARLVRQLREEGRHAQRRVDAVRGHGLVERLKEQRTPALRGVAHDLRKLEIGQHGRCSFGR